MKLATTTGDFRGYVKTAAEKVKCVAEAGFRHIDFSFYYRDFAASEDLEKQVEDAMAVATEYGVDFVQAHACDFDPFRKDRDPDHEIWIMKRTLKAADRLGIKNIVFHAQLVPGCNKIYPDGKDEFFRYNKKIFDLILPEAEKYGITVLVENGAEANTGGRYCLMTGRDMNEFIEYVGHKSLKAVWDIGHANLRGMNQYESIVEMSDNLYALHIQDNDGNYDEHTAPYSGTTNMDEIMQALLKINYKGYFTFEADNYIVRNGSWPYSRRPFNGETENKLQNPTLKLRMMADKLLYEIGKYILEQYGVFED